MVVLHLQIIRLQINILIAENYIFDFGNSIFEYLVDKNAPYNLNNNYPIKDTTGFKIIFSNI